MKQTTLTNLALTVAIVRALGDANEPLLRRLTGLADAATKASVLRILRRRQELSDAQKVRIH